MVKKRIIIPKRFVRVDNVSGTVAVRKKKSGRFTGRKKIKGRGDGTKIYRVIKDVDADGDKKPDFFGGTIVGRTKRVTIKASKRARSYQRRV